MTDIRNKNTFTTPLMNGETIAYSLFFAVSVIFLIAIKQFFKVFLGVAENISVLSAFVIAEVVFFLLEKRFVFRKIVFSSGIKQSILFIFRAAVNFGFFKLSQVLFGNILKADDSFVWLVTISICFVFNYYFDRNITFDCGYDAKSVINSKIYKSFFENRFILLSCLIAAVCISVIYLIYTVFPFGDATVMRMDLYHQYGPMYAELYERVTEHQSFLYSWNSGGGSSFLGNYFNYMSSPLTALIFLFDKEDISFAITTLVSVKCILSAGAFSYYLKKSVKASNCFTAIFGVFYAFSAYFLAYYWNVMWLDGMILLPIIALGIEKIINEGKGTLYVASLSLLFISSYYMGFMTCIFSVIYYIAYYFISSKYAEQIDSSLVFSKKYSFKAILNRKFFNRGLKFAFFSILSGALCAFMLIPVFMILKSSSATSDTFPSTFESYFTIFDFLTSHLAGLETTIRSSGDDVLPNVYSGILAVILLPLFAANKNIRIKEKFWYIVLLLFMLFSFDNNCMNFIWHAFHFPNDLPFRFSYMYSFLILVIGYKALQKINTFEIKDIAFVGMFWIIFVIFAQEMSTTKMSETTIYISIAFVLLWSGFLFLVKRGKLEKSIISAIALLICFSEVIVADTQAILITQSNSSYKENYDSYNEAISEIHNNDKGFYREELCYLETRMDPSYYGYNGISCFSSMAYEDYSQLQYSLGMFGNRINSYTYNTQTPVYNLMFAIKYLMRTEVSIEPSNNLYTEEFVTEDNKTQVFKNNYFLPIAYGVNENIDLWSVEEGNPFKIQSEFFELATGYSQVFKNVKYLSTEYDNLSGDEIVQNGTYWFSKYDSESTYGYADITITPEKDGNVYVYISSPDIKTIEISSDSISSHTQQIEEPYILDLGYYNAGDKIKISIDCGSSETEESYADIYCYTVDQEVLQNGYNRLLDSSLNVTDYNDTSIKGNITLNEDSYLYSSIPYDSGWKIYIDGNETETFKIGKSLLATSIKAGNHTVEYKYTPPGLYYGLAISGATFTAVIGYSLFNAIKKRKENVVNCKSRES